jgi:hypothetical protein
VQQLLNPQLSAKPTQIVSGAIKSQLSPDDNTLAVITAGYNTVYTGASNGTFDVRSASNEASPPRVRCESNASWSSPYGVATFSRFTSNSAVLST